MPFVLAYKVIIRQVTIISYSPVIQIKLQIFRHQNDRKKSAILTFKNKQSKATLLQKHCMMVYWAKKMLPFLYFNHIQNYQDFCFIFRNINY